uniref:Uncharacterized protein n=1 Tax=Ascaris lumbricoides TaxID=6252 RepID=A0A0M3IL94_ASCLU
MIVEMVDSEMRPRSVGIDWLAIPLKPPTSLPFLCNLQHLNEWDGLESFCHHQQRSLNDSDPSTETASSAVECEFTNGGLCGEVSGSSPLSPYYTVFVYRSVHRSKSSSSINSYLTVCIASEQVFA